MWLQSQLAVILIPFMHMAWASSISQKGLRIFWDRHFCCVLCSAVLCLIRFMALFFLFVLFSISVELIVPWQTASSCSLYIDMTRSGLKTVLQERMSLCNVNYFFLFLYFRRSSKLLKANSSQWKLWVILLLLLEKVKRALALLILSLVAQKAV